MIENPGSEIAPVSKRIEVNASPDEAFRVFTAGISRWWPLASHSVAGDDAVRCVFEPHEGGKLFEENRHGEKHVWGTVRVWSPPHRVVFSWHPGRGPDAAQEVEVLFEAIDTGTRLLLAHRGWESLGSAAAEVRGRYVPGWDFVLGHYRESMSRP